MKLSKLQERLIRASNMDKLDPYDFAWKYPNLLEMINLILDLETIDPEQ